MGGLPGEGTRDRLCPCEDGPRGPPPSVVAPVSVTSAGVVWSRVSGRDAGGCRLWASVMADVWASGMVWV